MSTLLEVTMDELMEKLLLAYAKDLDAILETNILDLDEQDEVTWDLEYIVGLLSDDVEPEQEYLEVLSETISMYKERLC
jgi:hypothetical protein